MASVKIYQRKKYKKDGTAPLVLSIIKDRKSSIISLGVYLDPKYWDESAQRVRKSHLNSVRLNNFLAAKVAEVNEKLFENEMQEAPGSAQTIKHKVKATGGNSFFKQAEQYLKNLKDTGNYNCWAAEKSRIKYFREFLKGRDIGFPDITPALLDRFAVHLKAGRGLGDRTIMNYLLVIRTIYNKGIKDGVAEQKHYPFGEGKISIRFPETTKRGLTEDDVDKLEDVQLADFKEDHARNLWLTSFYFAGMRISDVLRLRWSYFQDMRLIYRMNKTGKIRNLKVVDEVWAIIRKYAHLKEHADDLVFPDLKGVDFEDEFEVKRKIAFAVKWYDKILRERVARKAGIEGKVTMHIARHTYATIAGDEIPVQRLQELYGHSSVTTTIGYQMNFIHKETDDAHEKVLGRRRKKGVKKKPGKP